MTLFSAPVLEKPCAKPQASEWFSLKATKMWLWKKKKNLTASGVPALHHLKGNLLVPLVPLLLPQVNQFKNTLLFHASAICGLGCLCAGTASRGKTASWWCQLMFLCKHVLSPRPDQSPSCHLCLFNCSHLFSTGFFCLTHGSLKLTLVFKWKPVMKNLRQVFLWAQSIFKNISENCALLGVNLLGRESICWDLLPLW